MGLHLDYRDIVHFDHRFLVGWLRMDLSMNYCCKRYHSGYKGS